MQTVRGLIKRRLLVNYRADPELIQRILPPIFRPKLHRGHAIAGICLIRLEDIRPAGLPEFLGVSSENAAHRIAVEWRDNAGNALEGVYIPRRDTGSLLNHLAGGRLFPGEHHRATFEVRDAGGHVSLDMRANDGAIRVEGDETDALPAGSCFASLDESSAFFKGGRLGYSATSGGTRLDGVALDTEVWRVGALNVTRVASSYFDDEAVFPKGTVTFDHALIMRDIPHTWTSQACLCG